MAIASLILGILGVLSSFFTVGFGGMGLGLLALVFGILGRKGAMERGQPTGMATAGLVLGIVGLAMGVIFFVTCSLCVAAVKQNVEEAEKMQRIEKKQKLDELGKGLAGDDGKIVASCDTVATISTCTDYTGGAMILGKDTMKSLCEAANGITGQKDPARMAHFVDGAPCPTDGVLGTCTLKGGQIKRYYARGMLGYKPASAESDCTGLYSGTWAAAK